MGEVSLREVRDDDLPFPRAKNPWNPLHFAGGSSSGSGRSFVAPGGQAHPPAPRAALRAHYTAPSRASQDAPAEE